MSCLNHRGHIIADYSGIIANSAFFIAENPSNFDGYSEINTKKGRQNAGDLFSYLFRIQNQLLRFHLFSRYRKSYLSRLITGAQYYEGVTLEEMALNGFLQLGLSDMKFIRCDVSIIHRHDIRIAFYGESQLIECLGILI